MKKMFYDNLIKGIANVELSPKTVFEIAVASACVLGKGNPSSLKILVGKDTRISGDMIEGAITSAFCSLGVQVHIAGIMPTPALSYLVKKYGMDAGVVITATDAPIEYNGIKLLNADGNYIDTATEHEIEEFLNSNKTYGNLPVGANLGKVSRNDMGVRDYVDYIKDNTKGDFSGYKMAVDCGNGAAYQCAKLFFRELDANVTIINNRPNGINISADCGFNNTEALKKYVVENNCDFGFAYDGDAEFVCVIDENGNDVNSNAVLDLCVDYIKKYNCSITDEMIKKDAVMLSAQFVCALRQKGIKASELL